jgi:hypothetical protein
MFVERTVSNNRVWVLGVETLPMGIYWNMYVQVRNYCNYRVWMDSEPSPKKRLDESLDGARNPQ